jgi:archaellum biogenesis protein FlaJ (TadC family)
MSAITAFISQHFEWILSISLLLFLATLILVPMLIIRIPEDYFCHTKRRLMRVHHPLIKLVLLLLKNLLGGLLLAAGIIMLFTPGQGLVTLLLGLMIMDYPGKYTLECWLINRLRLLPALNWFRRRAGISSLKSPPDQNKHEK